VTSPFSQAASVVIPACNEELALERQIREIAEVMTQSGWQFEMIVVDDGSTDQTASVATHSGATVLQLGRNLGYGAALKAGIKAARFEWIVICDADGTYPALEIPRLLALAANTDMAVGARVGANVHTPWLRRPAKWLLRQYATVVTLHKIPDLNSGLRLISRPAALAFWDLYPAGFSFTTTITMAMLATGYRVSYVSIDYLPRIGKSKIRPVDFFRMLWLITRLGIRFRPLRVLVVPGLFFSWTAATYLWGSLAAAAVILSAAIFLERKARSRRRSTR
jgi:glycosyltransferase involved in cell wall biosynthesis